jgi:hypothetical protein
MPSTCHSTLKVYGPSCAAEGARKLVESIFGPSLREDASPFLVTEAIDPPLVAVRIQSTEIPPVALVRELSSREPSLVFKVVYANYGTFACGTCEYRNGEMTRNEESMCFADMLTEDAAGAFQTAAPADVAVAEVNPEQPLRGTKCGSPALREMAANNLAAGYALAVREFRGGESQLGKSEAIDELFAKCDAVKKLMGDDDVFFFEQLEEQHRHRVHRIRHWAKVRAKLQGVLHELSSPDIADRMSPAEREAAQVMARLLEMLYPRCDHELLREAEGQLVAQAGVS